MRFNEGDKNFVSLEEKKNFSLFELSIALEDNNDDDSLILKNYLQCICNKIYEIGFNKNDKIFPETIMESIIRAHQFGFSTWLEYLNTMKNSPKQALDEDFIQQMTKADLE